MNGERFTAAMGQIGDRYVEEALFYAAPSAANVRRRRLGVLLAAVIAALTLCGFASYELGLLDRWFQTPSDDPVQVVRSAIEGQADKAYTICVRVEEIAVDETETARAAAMLGKKPEEINIVTCHLGNGSSITAVKGGKSFDTTMGVTPLDGLMMGTRSGSIDPAIIPFLMEKEHMSAKDIDIMLNKKSGMLGVTQTTSDNRDIEQGAKNGNKRYQLVENMLCHQITKYIGGYAAAMGGIDAIVFTGGIGENNPQYRTRVGEKLEFMGVKVDEEINKKAFRTSEEFDISTPDAKVRMLVIPTNEELMIARDTYELVKNLK